MKAKDIFSRLLEGAIEIIDHTCDGLITGDENMVVTKAATCFKLTAEVLEKAVESGIEMIVTHEPTFSRGDEIENFNTTDLKKWEMLKNSKIVLYRLHDHAHHRERDYIHEGFIKELGLGIKYKHNRESLGVCRYELSQPTTTRELCGRIKEKLGMEAVKVVGETDCQVTSVTLGLGSVGLPQIEVLHNPGSDVFITGEVGEVCTCEYIRDACYFGDNKAVIILGHYGAEFAGMKFLAEEMNETLVPTEYIDSGEVFRYI